MPRGELLRKLVHVGCGGFAFLLRVLTPPQAALMAGAAFLFNWQVLPRIGGRARTRSKRDASAMRTAFTGNGVSGNVTVKMRELAPASAAVPDQTGCH